MARAALTCLRAWVECGWRRRGWRCRRMGACCLCIRLTRAVEGVLRARRFAELERVWWLGGQEGWKGVILGQARLWVGLGSLRWRLHRLQCGAL